jgi:uncharacterized protein
MPMIRETIVSTMSRAGQVHFAPIGLIAENGGWIIAPFRPSVTLDNMRDVPFAVANFTDDVRVFAGCLTGRADHWPTAACSAIHIPRLASALAHAELAVSLTTGDEERPRFHCRVLCIGSHAPFQGFNRAKAAIIEASILVSRLNMLPRDKIEREIAYLEIAVGKTASPEEEEAWAWLMERIRQFYASLGHPPQ